MDQEDSWFWKAGLALPVPSLLPCCGAPRLWLCGNGCCPKCQPGVPPPQELFLFCSPCPEPEVSPKPKVVEAPANPSLFSALCCRQKPWEMGPQVSSLLAPWAWWAARRGVQGQEQEKTGSSRPSTEGFGRYLVRSGKTWVLDQRCHSWALGPNGDPASRLGYPICEMKAFPALGPCISFK